MSRSKKSKTVNKLQGNKNNFQKAIEPDEEDHSFFSTKHKNNEINRNESPRINNDNKTLDIPGHSTPFQTRVSINDIEGSPEPDYRCSPILIPCTQDVNEVAWDWHSSISKPSDKEASEFDQVNTPKRNNILQKKRNSNSPLLYKPFRRKLVKEENIESIGKFAAELKALTEKMKSIQRNDEDHLVNKDHKEDEVVDQVEEDEISIRIALDSSTSNFVKTGPKISTSMEELFDESIEDSLVRCSQEVEAKLCSSKESSIANSSNGSRDKFIRMDSSSENSKNSLFSQSSPVLNVSSHSKTYSKTMHKGNAYESINVSEKKEEIKKKPSLNNNIVNVHNGNLQNRTDSGRKNSSDLFEIPDDSFDDCLATCIEEDKLSEHDEYDDIFSDLKPHPNEKHYEYGNSDNKDASKKTNSDTSNRSVGKSAIMENRKFFKFKSLSDSYFGQEKNTSSNNKAGTSNPRQITKYFSHSNLPSKVQVNTSGKNTANGNVYANKNVKLVNPKESVYALSTNKIISKDSGCSMSKSNSVTGDSQIMRCTPEEIERKRLEAKMRLEAKRKMQQNVAKSNISEVPVKRVQR